MALHNSFKQGQSQQQDNRLESAPTADDLGSALSQARTSGKRPVVISWKSPKTNAVFWLTVTASGAGNEAEWLLQKGAEGVQPKNVWNHKTMDTTLIQSLLAAEEEMAFKSGNRTLVTPPPSNGQHAEESPWDAARPSTTTTGGNAPIVLGGGGLQQPQRPENAPQPPVQAQSPWQGSQAPGWNMPQPGTEKTGWGYLPPNTPAAPQPGENPSTTSNPNLFAGLKGTVEEPKPANPFNSLMSNQNLPQLPPQTKQIDLPEKPLQTSGHKFVDELDEVLEGAGSNDPPANTYNGPTNSSQGIKAVPDPSAMPSARPPAPGSNLPRIHSSQTSSSARIPIVNPGDAHSPQVHPPVPNFAAMTSSGAYPVVSVPPDQALGPKGQTKGAMSVNQVRGNSSPQSGSYSQQNQPKVAPPATPPSSPAPERTRQLPAPVELDRGAVDGVFKSLSNNETGLLNHGSMLFFLVREFSRYQTSNEPFALIIMGMSAMTEATSGQPMTRQLPLRAVRAAAQKIFSLTRQLDLVSHYEQTDFAILLPCTTRQEAKEFAQSVAKLLASQPLAEEMESMKLVLRMGLASFPEDTSHPGILLAAASEAKLEAHRSGKTLVLFAET